MKTSEFIDYYEILELSPNANSATVDRMFRFLAQRYHPDNRDTGDRDRFDLIMEAHQTLRDPIERVHYDVKHKNHSNSRWKLVEEASDLKKAVDVQNQILSVLYAKCRQDVSDPGIGDLELERLLGCPPEHLSFPIWYLKEKGWIGRTEQGLLAITVEGVDRASSEHHHATTRRLLTAYRQTG